MWLSAILGFFQALPELIKIYKLISKAIGKAKLQSFLSDLETNTKLIEDSKQPGLTLEQKREMRKKALEHGSSLWARALD